MIVDTGIQQRESRGTWHLTTSRVLSDLETLHWRLWLVRSYTPSLFCAAFVTVCSIEPVGRDVAVLINAAPHSRHPTKSWLFIIDIETVSFPDNVPSLLGAACMHRECKHTTSVWCCATDWQSFKEPATCSTGSWW